MKNQSAHSLLICHIVSIKVDKQGLDIFKLGRQIMYLPPKTPKLCLMTKSSMKISGFRFQTWKFQKPPKIQLHFRATKKDPCLPFHFHVFTYLNLGQILGLTKI